MKNRNESGGGSDWGSGVVMRDSNNTSRYLTNRLGNSLVPCIVDLKQGTPNKGKANHCRETFIKTLEYAIESNTPETNGVTHENLRELIELANNQDWTNEEDVEAIEKRAYEILEPEKTEED